MKFKEDRPFPTPEAAERKLLELANAVEPDHAGRLSVEIINRQFRDAGGSYEGAISGGLFFCDRNDMVEAVLWDRPFAERRFNPTSRESCSIRPR
jgi:hypothetical protein